MGANLELAAARRKTVLRLIVEIYKSLSEIIPTTANRTYLLYKQRIGRTKKIKHYNTMVVFIESSNYIS